MKELDRTATPLPFTCYYAKRVDDPTFVESKLHQAFDEFRIRDNREFFRMSPDQAWSGDILKNSLLSLILNSSNAWCSFDSTNVGSSTRFA